MNELELLKATRTLFSDKEKWGTGWYARNEAGTECSVESPDACKFCLVGGLAYSAKLLMADFEDSDGRYYPLMKELTGRSYMFHMFNDDEGYDAVMSALDEAITKREVADAPVS